MPPKKNSRLIITHGQISILLVEESQIARSAWKRILQKSGQIQIVGEVAPNQFLRGVKQLPPSEIIIAGYSFVEKRLIRSKNFIKALGYFPKTIIICENTNQVAAAYKARADWAVAKPFNDQDLVTWVRVISDEAKRLCEEYYAQLLLLQNEDQPENRFKLIRSILQLLLHPDLVNPEKVELPGSTSERLVFRNQAKKRKGLEDSLMKFDEFWEDLRQDHQGKYVPIDVLTSEITSVAVHELRKYLTNSHGLFGMIIGHGSVSRRTKSLASAIYENEEKVILLLDDQDIQEMLEYKAGGINPACLLKNLYQDLIVRAVS